MKKSIVMAMAAVALLASCKSSESAYKKAYEKAVATQSTTTETTVVETPVVTPLVEVPTTQTVVQTPTVTTPTETPSFRTESLTVVDGSALRAYSVVVGSFSLRANAEGLANTLRSSGYDARIAYNSDRNMYRVNASSYDSKDSAVSSRNSLRSVYPDAWLLFQK